MGYTLEGIVKIIQETQTFGSGFTKREFVVTVEDGKYPQDICLECVKDRISQLDGVSVGDSVSVSFDIRGREYNGRYFNSLVCWSVRRAGNNASGSPQNGRTGGEAGYGSPDGGSGSGGQTGGSGASDDFSDSVPF